MNEGGVKYLVETSAVPAALGLSTTAHRRHCDEAVRDGRQWTSIYIRMEFIRVFYCELAHMAFFISQRSSVRDSLVLLSNRFSIRKIKVDMIALGTLLEQRSAMHEPALAALEIARLANLWLKSFDRTFREKTPNQVGCLIGNKRPTIDYKTLLQDLNAFYEDFTENVPDCPINDFLGVGNAQGKAHELLGEEKPRRIDSVKQLAGLMEAGRRFSCDKCRKIGDAVIALEQPEDQCLVHLDKAFNEFCVVLKREHKHLKSASAIDKAAKENPSTP